MKIKEKLIRLLFPQKCAVCGRVVSGGYLCADCGGKLKRITNPRCGVCGRPFGSEYAMAVCSECMAGKPYEKIFVPFEYTGGAREAVLSMKFRRRPGTARFLGREIFSEIGDFRPDFITFVPQSRRTGRKRGYNQTRLLAKELGRCMGVPVIPTLIRVGQGKNQVGLSQSERLKNAKKLYLPMNKRLRGTALITDDVITTGSTMTACCSLLKKMGCESVYGAAAAKTVKLR